MLALPSGLPRAGRTLTRDIAHKVSTLCRIKRVGNHRSIVRTLARTKLRIIEIVQDDVDVTSPGNKGGVELGKTFCRRSFASKHKIQRGTRERDQVCESGTRQQIRRTQGVYGRNYSVGQSRGREHCDPIRDFSEKVARGAPKENRENSSTTRRKHIGTNERCKRSIAKSNPFPICHR